jgi:N,N-dimethylformamidase beta subunit-like, C-terminal
LTAATLLALLTCACGGGHRASTSTTRAAEETAKRAAGAEPYRWLIATQGPQPSVAAENRNPGTSAWRLPGPAADVGGLRIGDVAGYVADQAIRPGQTQRIYVSAPGSSSVRVALFRIGWYGGAGGREVLVSRRLQLVPQPACTHRAATGLTECDWHPTITFAVPSALPSGVYIAKLSAPTGQSDCLFVVLASHPQPLLAQLPTSTYEAYNAWGGDSLYPGGADRVGLTGTTQGIEVSYDRPYDSVTGAGQFFARDVAMIWFLERYGYPVSYTTSESVDEDPGQVYGHRALIDFGHSEYWSQRQANAFAVARDAGTSLLFLGSDTLAWRVRYAPASAVASEAGQADHSMVSYKEHAALDPDHHAPTGPFPAGGAPLTGSAYLGCITPRLPVTGPPTYHYYAWAPSPGLQPSWLFASTGVTAATRIPGIVGYELDMRTPQSPAATRLIGSGAAPCMTPEPGEPAPGPGQDLAETTLYTAPSGALVFASGALGWELGLAPVPSASPDAPRAPDPRVVAMTRNLLARVLSAPAGGR